jgi:hypothetical protein
MLTATLAAERIFWKSSCSRSSATKVGMANDSWVMNNLGCSFGDGRDEEKTTYAEFCVRISILANQNCLQRME